MEQATVPITGEATGDAVYRRVAWRLVPFLLLCYVLAIIDRFNIGFAKLQFIQDLRLNDAIYGLAAGAFSVGYVAFEVPSNLLLERVGVRKTLLRIMVLWGIVTSAMMFVRGATHLYVLRFLLGVAEAGFFPGILFYLTYWFPDRKRGRMTSLFVTAVPIAGVIGGPVSGWLMDHTHGVGGLRGWQWLFLLEGIPSVLLGVVAYFVLTDRPASAAWLSVAEKETILADQASDRARSAVKPTRSFGDALRSGRVYALAAIYFAYFCSLNSILLWTPTLLRLVGIRTLTDIGRVSGAMSLIATAGMIVIGYSSDRFLERRWHVALSGLTAAGAFLLLPFAAHSVAVTVLLLTIASIGIYRPRTVLDDPGRGARRERSRWRDRAHQLDWNVRWRVQPTVRRLAEGQVGEPLRGVERHRRPARHRHGPASPDGACQARGTARSVRCRYISGATDGTRQTKTSGSGPVFRTWCSAPPGTYITLPGPTAFHCPSQSTSP